VVWTVLSAALLIAAKRLLIGRYRAGRHPHMGGMYLRHWLVNQIARSVPWEMLDSLRLRSIVLAAARRAYRSRRGTCIVACRCSMAAGTCSRSRTVSRSVVTPRWVCVTYDRQQLVFAPIIIGLDATLDTRARMAPGASLGREAFLGPLAGLLAGHARARR
jgi:hypothetical protein